MTTRVRGPNKDYWKKLLRLMQYLRNTFDMPLTIRADGTNIVKWRVRHAQSNRWNNVAGKGIDNQHLHKTEYEQKDIDRGRNNCG